MRLTTKFSVNEVSIEFLEGYVLCSFIHCDLKVWLDKLQLLLGVGTKLEHIITKLALELQKNPQDPEVQRVKPSDEHFWFRKPGIVLYLIQFILFQNSFEIAFFFWIWVSQLLNSFSFVVASNSLLLLTDCKKCRARMDLTPVS